MYDHFSPYLYSRVEVNRFNKLKVLYGLDYDLEKHKQEGRRVDSMMALARSKRTMDALMEEILGPPLEAHNRKLKLLNMVKTLVITDFFAAEAIARSFHPEYSDYLDKDGERHIEDEMYRKHPDLRPHLGIKKPFPVPKSRPLVFQNVENISLGYQVLAASFFYSICKHDGEPIIHPIIKALAKGLNCKNVSHDYEASMKYHKDGYDENFDLTLKPFLDNWDFTTSNWHNMNQIIMPCTHSTPKMRLFFDPDSVQENPTKNHPLVIPEEDEVAQASLMFYDKRFASETSDEDSYDDCMEAAQKRWKQRKDSGWYEKYAKIVNWEDAEPCVCCGEKRAPGRKAYIESNARFALME
ncbi:uncharacterized protein L199_007770 [Kwoniella botswanensis]|uniref:uncharacterized protein n=1 Tax=Kwoniella botswanensis TaxID=1268659 RepID=UPI00315D5AC3